MQQCWFALQGSHQLGALWARGLPAPDDINIEMQDHFAQDHFTRVAAVYRKVRTTDPEPINHIAQEFDGHSSVRVADIGCGAGRYDLLLFDALPGLHLTCIDTNQAMLGKAAQLLSDNGIDRFETRQIRAEALELSEQSFDCVVSFNAVHYFDLDDFLRVTRDGLKEDGHLFVYTRLPAQNARTIWGRYFPGFVEKEVRLIELEMMYRSIERTESLFFSSAACFRYQRTARLDRLMEQAHNRHYSTFSLYEDGEFNEAMAIFERRMRDRFADHDQITWHDENILFHARRFAV